jgi:hypothetical protein
LRTGLRCAEIFKLKGQDVDALADVLYITAKGGSRTAVRIPAVLMRLPLMSTTTDYAVVLKKCILPMENV